MSVAVDLQRSGAALDLERRLQLVPDSACSRGVFFNMVADDLRKRGYDNVPELRFLFDRPRRSYALYPTRDLVHAYGIAGALMDPDPIEGMRLLWSDTPRYFSATWYGRAFARYLQPDPCAGLSWIERSRDYVANYGRWRIERRGANRVVFHMFDEYLWIDGAQRGGCEGLLLACGVKGQVEPELDSPFCGRLHITWERR